MNDDNKVYALALGMYGILFNNKWRMTVILFDGTRISGRLKGQNTTTEPYQVTITLTTDDGSAVTIDLRNVQDITT
jgi:hypothetical protein